MKKFEITEEQIKEEWRDVINYEGLYQVSNLGNVKSLDKFVNCKSNSVRFIKGKVLSPNINPEGRFYVTLSNKSKVKTFKIHQLVAMSFLNHTPCGYKKVVDHINNNPLDNRLCNLQIITQRENMSKNRKNKSSKYTGVWFCNTKKVWKSEISINGKRFNLGSFKSEIKAYEAYNSMLKSIID